MIRTLTLLALAGGLAFSCKPTVRTAEQQNQPQQQEQQAAEPAAQQPAQTQAEAPAAADPSNSLVDVNSTNQDYNILQPWEKESPGSNSTRGIYLGNNLVLCNGKAADAATYVELALPDGSRTVTAKVVRFDPDLHLALLTLEHEEDADFFADRTPLEVGEPLRIGDKAEFAGLIQGIKPVHAGLTVESADAAGMPRLNLHAERSLPDGAGMGCPVIKDGKLVAMSLGYRAQNQMLSCINAELISRFLNQKENAGVPMVGFSLIELKDPVFRKYLKIDDPKAGGLYVNKVEPSGAAAEAGMKEGDVLTAIEGIAIDNTGRCQHPVYGPLSATCLLNSYKPVGETLKLSLLRDGQPVEITLPLNRDAAEKSLVREMQPGERPRYIMWGGLLFQPVTDDFLRAIRERAQDSLPLSLACIEDNEDEYRKEGRKELVVLSLVVPTPATLGYDNARFTLVTKVNGKDVHSFDEFAKMIDEKTPDGLVRISLNKIPYDIYLSNDAVQRSNEVIRMQAIPRLRYVGGEEPQK
ncbi:MAG: PDZ domain-containing protein [Akkermansia sp.]|nr:PDZ domain-containing protein [Akkermansia sp.]